MGLAKQDGAKMGGLQLNAYDDGDRGDALAREASIQGGDLRQEPPCKTWSLSAKSNLMSPIVAH